MAAHHAFIEENGLEIRGRIYINQQGINAQMSGRGEDGETVLRDRGKKRAKDKDAKDKKKKAKKTKVVEF